MSFWRNFARFAVVAALGVGLAGCGINKIPAQDEKVKAARAEVQNQ